MSEAKPDPWADLTSLESAEGQIAYLETVREEMRAEIERLQARLTAAEAIVVRLGTYGPPGYRDYRGDFRCGLCAEKINDGHAPNCVWLQARQYEANANAVT